jgi:hypothetical protein
MLTHVLVSVEHTVGHLVCNGGAGYISKVPALFKVKVNPLPHIFLYVWCLYALFIGLLQQSVLNFWGDWVAMQLSDSSQCSQTWSL